MPIELSEQEMQTLLDLSRPLDRAAREPFMYAVMDALRMRPVIGPGVVHRVAADMQPRFFRPPVTGGPGTIPKYRR